MPASTASASKTSTPTATSFPARPARWMRSNELAAAQQEADERLVCMDDDERTVLIQKTRRRLREEIAFIGNEQFGDAGYGVDVFAEGLDLPPRQTQLGIAALRKSGVDLPIHLGRLCEAPLLTPEQERMLFQRMNFLLFQASLHRQLLSPERPSRKRLELIERLIALADWHRDRIVESNLRLVFSVVKKFVNENNSFDDLLSDGIVALIRAVEKFDFDRGFRFSTYATQVLRRNSYRTVVTNQQDRQKVVGGLQDMDIEISDEDKTSAISEKRWHELRSRLAVMLNELDRREKLIVRARFALGSHRKVHTLQALADRLGISKERVRQLERRAMDKLRAMAGEVQLTELEST
ncbi:MAG: sigma-70 family RNA polymerase sigma factor [Planctomycetota bacterium]